MNGSDVTLAGFDLAALIGHRHRVSADATVEEVQKDFARHRVDFLAVLREDRILGVCSRHELTQTLGSRFGFALNARRPIAEHLMKSPLRLVLGMELTEVFRATSAREEREFYDDALLVGRAGEYVGLIPVRTLVRLQTETLLGNIARLEASRREISEKNQQMEDDLRMAREVQLALLPQAAAGPAVAGPMLRTAHHYRPTGVVSGDFFDVYHFSERATGILICDVMGHGVRSALITVMVRAMLEQLRAVAADPGGLLTELNRHLTRILRQTGSLIFVTAAYAVIDVEAGGLRYAQAGHPTALRWDGARGVMRPIACSDEQAGPALGLIDDFVFGTAEEPLAAGDRVVLFTDGLIEATSRGGEEFGAERLAAALARHRAQEVAAALAAVVGEISSFVDGAAFADDVCLVAAEVAVAR